MAKGKKTGGRTVGTPNKITSTVKQMVLDALDEKGGVDYLVEQAGTNPTAFMTLVGKVLPTEITGEDGGDITFTIKKIVHSARDSG